MDYDNPQFVAAVKKILRTENNEPPVDPQANADIQRELPNVRVDISATSIDQIKANSPQERSHEQWRDFFEVLGIGVVALYTMFAYFQWSSLNTANLNQSAANISSGATADRSLMEISKTAKDTHELAVQAKEQAKAANTSAEIAAQSLKSLQDQFRLDQRPYITIKGFSTTDYTTAKPSLPTIGQPIVASVTFNNVGKSQALNTIIHCHLLFGDKISNYKIEHADTGRIGATVVQLQDNQFATAVSIQDTYTREGVGLDPSAVIKWDGSMPIVLFGRISYQDIYGTIYCLPYSVIYIPSGSSGTWGESSAVNGIPTQKLCPTGKR